MAGARTLRFAELTVRHLGVHIAGHVKKVILAPQSAMNFSWLGDQREQYFSRKTVRVRIKTRVRPSVFSQLLGPFWSYQDPVCIMSKRIMNSLQYWKTLPVGVIPLFSYEFAYRKQYFFFGSIWPLYTLCQGRVYGVHFIVTRKYMPKFCGSFTPSLSPILIIRLRTKTRLFRW